MGLLDAEETVNRVNFPAIYLLHGRGGSPNGSVSQLEAEMRVCEPGHNYIRPLMPHADPAVTPLPSMLHLRSLGVPNGALVIGISLGGLVAAKLQEIERPDLHVICISSPTHAEDTELTMRMERRVALYSSADEVIAGRTERWPELAEAYDLPWLDHDTDKHKTPLGRILCAYVQGLDVSQEVAKIGAMKDMTAEKLKSLLNLVPLSIEGGYFSETYRSREMISAERLQRRYSSPRSVCTAIYYLLEPGTFSEIHRVASDEIFHFYLGDAVEMLQLWPDGSAKRVLIGTDIESGMAPQLVVPHGVWQGARLAAGGKFALLGCTVSPGFDYADYESGSRAVLSEAYPEYAEMIRALTRE